VLRVGALSAYYGKKQVLFDVDLVLDTGTIAALIGPNGAGKSTVLRAIFGLGPRRQGAIAFDGRDVSRAGPADNVRAGLVFVPQGARVFRDLTVDENLLMAAYTIGARADVARRRADVLAAFPPLRGRIRQRAGSMSGGERQMLAFAMALMLSPKVLLIDEPSIGLAPRLVTQVFDNIRRIRDQLGTAVLVVEQQAQQVLRVAESVYVIRAGTVIAHGPVEQFREEGALRRVYLSEPSVGESDASGSHASGPPVNESQVSESHQPISEGDPA
jgi:branched-chain amino acid transport system ATP-binding protein